MPTDPVAAPTAGDDAPFGPPLIGALMRMPVEVVRARMLAALHARGFTDIVPAHLVVLRWPGPQGRRPSAIAAQAEISKQALNYLLGQLEELGYLERRPDADDQRSRRIHLTARGREVAETMRGAVGDVEAEWTELLGARDFQRLRALLVRLNEALAPS
jgi:DNA-binding MarR family transcriptional regulator